METARFHLLQIELSGPNPRVHGSCALEIDHKDSKVNVGNCQVEIEVSAADVKPLVDKVKAELARLAADPRGPESARLFKDVPIE